MKKVKMFFCMAMAVALLGHTTTTVWAAVNHVDGCNNTVYTYNQCKDYICDAGWGSHSVTSGNGTVTCVRTAEIWLHDILCANSDCRALYESNKAMACVINHAKCGETETDYCKRQ